MKAEPAAGLDRAAETPSPDAGERGRFPSPLLALEFLTVLSLRGTRLTSSAEVARAQLWYPAVGLAIGGAVAAADRMLTDRLPVGPTAALLLVLLYGVPGLLHLDGLTDAADGLLSLNTRERRLEIMRDSRTGAFGVAAVGLCLLVSFSSIEALHGTARTPALLLAPVAGRVGVVMVMILVPYARQDGLATGFTGAARSWIGIVAVLSGTAICVAIGGVGGLVLIAAGCGVAAAVGYFSRLRVGGVTGDVIGAVCVLAEAAALLIASGIQGGTWLRPWI